MNHHLMLHDVRQFMAKLDYKYFPNEPIPLSQEIAEFRHKCLLEEVAEMDAAKNYGDTIDAIVDLAYFAVGTQLLLGTTHIHQPMSLSAATSQQRLITAYEQIVDHHYPPLFHSAIHAFLKEATVDPVRASIHVMSVLDWCQTLGHCFSFAFNKHWMEVHEKNMQKQMATKENPSKRGVILYDTIKPEGWTPPDHYRILQG